jgi:putative ABC transport system substrate-binding protein
MNRDRSINPEALRFSTREWYVCRGCMAGDARNHLRPLQYASLCQFNRVDLRPEGGCMRRREFITVVASAAMVWPRAMFAQSPPKVYRVGLLSAGAPIADNSPLGAPLIRGLAQRGYELGRNLTFERRGADAHLDRLPQLVTELAASKVDLIITSGYPPALAAKKETSVPVVAINAGDPVGTGLVASLAHPGGNITGISDVSAEVTPKRLELLKEIAPNLRRVAMLWNADDLGMTLRYRASETGAQALGVSVVPLGVREPNDFDQAFRTLDRALPDAILMVTDSLTVLNRKRVFEFAAAHRLPAIYEFDFLVHDGGLMSYGPDQDESFSRVADLADRIFKGAKPADLPFEEPTLFRFALNLKTAKSIGLEVPPSLLVQADDVIE